MWCKNCNRETDEEVCSVCGIKTEEDIPYELHWCDECKVPLIKAVNGADRDTCPLCGGNTSYLVADLRPVFPEERLLLEILSDKPLAYINKSVWASNNRYYIDGKLLVNGWEIYQKIITEAAFQHYGAKTYCVDFVDNHWTALWFGLYHWDEVEKTYYLRNNGMQGEKDKEYVKESDFVKTINAPKKPKKTEISLDDSKIEELRECAEKGDIPFDVLVERCIATKYKRILATWKRQCENIKAKNDYIIHMQNTDHLFLFLFVADTNVPQVNGLYIAENSYTVDLRKALPSNFLRPCAQHGWIVRGKENSYDFDERIACIVRMDIDLAKKMLGNGELISMENFFPNEKIDQGYKILLARQEGSRINTKYDKILPDGIIVDLKQ